MVNVCIPGIPFCQFLAKTLLVQSITLNARWSSFLVKLMKMIYCYWTVITIGSYAFKIIWTLTTNPSTGMCHWNYIGQHKEMFIQWIALLLRVYVICLQTFSIQFYLIQFVHACGWIKLVPAETNPLLMRTVNIVFEITSFSFWSTLLTELSKPCNLGLANMHKNTEQRYLAMHGWLRLLLC